RRGGEARPAANQRERPRCTQQKQPCETPKPLTRARTVAERSIRRLKHPSCGCAALTASGYSVAAARDVETQSRLPQQTYPLSRLDRSTFQSSVTQREGGWPWLSKQRRAGLTRAARSERTEPHRDREQRSVWIVLCLRTRAPQHR